MKQIAISFSFFLSLVLFGYNGQSLKPEIARNGAPGAIEKIQNQNVSESYLSTHSSSETVGVDFRFAARKATRGVVHIKSGWTLAAKEDFLKELSRLRTGVLLWIWNLT